MTHHDKARELVELLLAYDARTTTGRITRRAADFITAQIEENRRLREALSGLMGAYKAVADSGDAGFWKAEETPEYQAARAALSSTGEKG